MLHVVDHVPPGLLDCGPSRLHEVLPGPTLIRLQGRRPEPLFVAVLLHGNETTGLLAVQELLARYAARPLPRTLWAFIGNVAAARAGRRRLEGQPDYNRIWRGGSGPEWTMARGLIARLRTHRPFAAIDIHNNSGLNPHYAIVGRLDNRPLQLAALFGRTIVYSTRPESTVTRAMSEFCPAVTLECGLPGRRRGTEHALEYLEACLRLLRIPDAPVHERDVDLLHTVAIVKIPDGYSFGFGRPGVDIELLPEMDRLNFRELAAGTVFARLQRGSAARLEVWDESGRDATDRYFVVADGEIRLARPVIPSMLTLQEEIIRLDCLCYFMERLPQTAAYEARASAEEADSCAVPG